MKKLLFIAMMAFASITTVNAQKESGLELGGSIGVSTSVIATSDSQITSDNLTSFNLAASAEYYFSDRWGLKAKLILDNKGWGNGFVQGQGSFTTTDIKLTYLTLPVTANWHFGSTRKWYLHFGLYAGFLLNAEAKATGMDVSDAIESVDIGLAAGIGYKFPIAENTNMFIEYDGQGGFTDVFANNTGTSVRNSRASFNVGVLFDLD
ncbi:porin family protein [Flavobacteriaceae bacterium S356]|uniref:Porin family protein n=1 Tax=Asprobacillus argus TaxID=3076534 RepID=A0ABU3LE08_9FLAO|nr:porin family protein [Flavobacteriaceae bacterium S356]